MDPKKIIFVVGPTAVGKSDVALQLARLIEGEIISCDSMQIYKEIRIATNRPSDEDCASVPHHLVGILSVSEEFDVAHFKQLATKAIQEIHQKGRIPIVTGGSGMYVQVLLDGIFESGAKNETLRKDLKEQARQKGNQYLYDKLKETDPKAAAKIHPNDVRRVVRALEIGITENIPISDLQRDRQGLWGQYDISIFALNRERSELYERINRRVEAMFAQGIIDEIEAVGEGMWSRTAKKIIGVQEVLGYLHEEYGIETAKERIKLNTRHLAKRQLTWFRRDDRLDWIMVDPEDNAQDIAQFILNEWREAQNTGI